MNNFFQNSLESLRAHIDSPAIWTAILFLLYFVVRGVLHRKIESQDMIHQDKNYLKRKIENYSFYLLVIILLFMWAETLRPFLFSLVALAAAIVLALKELIMCFTGGMLIRVSKTFKEGQRIEVDGIRGFVIERGLLATKILEIGPEKNSQQTTGDFVTIPNSLMLSKSLKNESYFKGFSIKSFVFEIDYLEGVENLEASLLRKAKEITDSYLAEAKESISRFCEKEGIGIPSIEPRTKILIGECSRVSLLLKIPVQNGRIADIEQDINRFYLDWTIKNVPESYRAKKK